MTQNQCLNLKTMHKLEFCLIAVSDLIKTKDPILSDHLIHLASASHNYMPPKNTDLDVSNSIFNALKYEFNPINQDQE